MKENISLSPPENTLFDMMDKVIKSYRQYDHHQIRENDSDITVDKWLVLKTVLDHPEMTQKEIANQVFKDHALVTIMIELMVQRKFLKRSFPDRVRRRYKLDLTSSGKKTVRPLNYRVLKIKKEKNR